MSDIDAVFHQATGFEMMIKSLQSPELRIAAARGLNEHAAEQRRMSITRIAASTGVPKGRVSGGTIVIKASPSGSMTAIVRNADRAVMLAEYGNPAWVRTSAGAQATAWNVRRTFPHAFIANGHVVVRTTKSRYPLKVLSAAVLANELAKPSRPNVPAAQAYVTRDLEKRVLKHVLKVIGG